MSKKTVKAAEGVITSAGLLEWARKRLGAELKVSNVFNTEVTRDSIRHFVDGIGDVNPLWRDEHHAAKTSYGEISAPPNWLYSVFPTWVLQGLPGVHAFHSGNEWTFHKPIRLGDRIRPECTFSGFEVRRSEFAGKTVFEYQFSRFYNQSRELLAEVYSWLIRAERRSARKRGKYSSYALPHPWSDRELARIEEEVLAPEYARAVTRYWDDVRVGEELPALIKGPFGITDMIGYCVGADPVGIKSFRAALELYRKHPAWSVRDGETHALEPIYAVHYNKAVANAAGLPYPYDVGVQRNCWLIQLLSNYMGDEGWIRKSYAEYRRFFYLSDVLWFKGRVVRKYVSDDGEACVDIETHAINQRGEDTMPGYATVALPSRQRDTWPVRDRLKRRRKR